MAIYFGNFVKRKINQSQSRNSDLKLALTPNFKNSCEKFMGIFFICDVTIFNLKKNNLLEDYKILQKKLQYT